MAELIRDTRSWPHWPWLAVRRELADGELDHGLVYEEDVAAGEHLRVFGSTLQAEVALVEGTLIDGKELAVVEEYESLEAMLAEGWTAAL